MNIHRSGLLAAACLVTSLSLACSSGGDAPQGEAASATTTAAPTTATAQAGDPCLLLSADAVGAIAGLTGAKGVASKSGGADVCTWSDASGTSAVVQIFPASRTYDEIRDVFQSFYESDVEAIADLGDQAFHVGGRTASMPTATVGARKGSTLVSTQLMALGGDDATLRGQALDLARAVLDAL